LPLLNSSIFDNRRRKENLNIKGEKNKTGIKCVKRTVWGKYFIPNEKKKKREKGKDACWGTLREGNRRNGKNGKRYRGEKTNKKILAQRIKRDPNK